MTTTSGTHLQGLYSTQVRHHTHIDMLHVVSALLNMWAGLWSATKKPMGVY